MSRVFRARGERKKLEFSDFQHIGEALSANLDAGKYRSGHPELSQVKNQGVKGKSLKFHPYQANAIAQQTYGRDLDKKELYQLNLALLYNNAGVQPTLMKDVSDKTMGMLSKYYKGKALEEAKADSEKNREEFEWDDDYYDDFGRGGLGFMAEEGDEHEVFQQSRRLGVKLGIQYETKKKNELKKQLEDHLTEYSESKLDLYKPIMGSDTLHSAEWRKYYKEAYKGGEEGKAAYHKFDTEGYDKIFLSGGEKGSFSGGGKKLAHHAVVDIFADEGGKAQKAQKAVGGASSNPSYQTTSPKKSKSGASANPSYQTIKPDRPKKKIIKKKLEPVKEEESPTVPKKQQIKKIIKKKPVKEEDTKKKVVKIIKPKKKIIKKK